MPKVNGRQAAPLIRSLTPFTSHGALSAGPSAGLTLGKLPREYDASVKRATYVVLSYETPIAWVTDGVWHRPATRYSMTTSHHQGRCPVDGTPA